MQQANENQREKLKNRSKNLEDLENIQQDVEEQNKNLQD